MKTIAIWLLLGLLCVAQSPFNPEPVNEGVQLSQVTFLVADRAELATDGTRVVVLAEGLDDKREYGVIVKLAVPAKWLEVHPIAKPFPPKVERPYKENSFLIRGAPGERFYVSIRRDDGPTWIEVTVAPNLMPQPPPVDPTPTDPPVNPGTLTELSRSLSKAMQDPATSASLKASLSTAVSNLEALCRVSQCPTLPAARSQVIAAIERALLARTNPSKDRPDKDWLKGWREPISKAINDKNPIDTKTYVALVRSVVDGIE
jgi:hypothetical protein